MWDLFVAVAHNWWASALYGLSVGFFLGAFFTDCFYKARLSKKTLDRLDKEKLFI